ncbi:MAG: type II toxin-antitoxin system PemK/MazF family toxin, partial [Limisphaerales bacterium]
MSKARRGEIWGVEFRPAVGAEIRKLRPAVIINSPEIGRLPLCIVAPVTEWKPIFAEFSWFV